MNKRALIIGGSSGIGLATVKKLAKNGFKVDLIHRDRRQQVQLLQDEINQIDPNGDAIRSYNVDGTNKEKVQRTVEGLFEYSKGQYQIVVHALSRGNLKPIVSKERKLEIQDFNLTIESMGINLNVWTQSLLEKNLIGQGSRIVGLTSEGNERVWPGYGAVGIAKSTLETLCNYLAVELAPMGVNVNVIQAGVTDTPSLRLIPEVENLIETSIKRNPKNRLTTPEDVANAIYLLTLPEADWINGSLIHVDGGEHLI
ncbi:MAG: SDR family oxidoreductase [Cyclobacteriaceae bacterium]